VPVKVHKILAFARKHWRIKLNVIGNRGEIARTIRAAYVTEATLTAFAATSMKPVSTWPHHLGSSR